MRLDFSNPFHLTSVSRCGRGDLTENEQGARVSAHARPRSNVLSHAHTDKGLHCGSLTLTHRLSVSANQADMSIALPSPTPADR